MTNAQATKAIRAFMNLSRKQLDFKWWEALLICIPLIGGFVVVGNRWTDLETVCEKHRHLLKKG